MTREEAIRDIEECVIPYVGGISLRMAVEALKEQRPHGDWEKVGEMTYKCTKCGWLKKTGLMPYCENCGSDNRKREGDEK